MKIRMLKTENGSVDGIRVSAYLEGEEYDLSGTPGERDLSAAFIGAGLAEDVGEKQIESPGAAQSAPENKAVEPDENKQVRKRK